MFDEIDVDRWCPPYSPLLYISLFLESKSFLFSSQIVNNNLKFHIFIFSGAILFLGKIF
ncbi:MAG TPA: hypothetical protein PLE45_11160 [Spirochaetota bacterium]|nr:hypothetical protein [Spirochaetota bacterium]HPP05287.1 hypothetical protein [Spirochaetota bacterium]